MPIDDRLRSTLHRRAESVRPDPSAWAGIERGLVRHRRRAATFRGAAGSLFGLAFIAGLAFLAIDLRSTQRLEHPPRSALVVTAVRVNSLPGYADIEGRIQNTTPHPLGAVITCRLL